MIGEIAALTCALFWAVSSRLFRVLGGRFTPLSLNFWKGIIALSILLIITQGFMAPIHLSQEQILWLLLSGVIGIGIGDTFFFKALNTIGDSQSLLVAETLAPIFTALLAMAWISEWLTWQQWLGIAIVIFCVDIIIKLQRRMQADIFQLNGYVFAGMAALCQALGAVISRHVLTTTDIDALNASQIRLAGGLVIVIMLMLLKKQSWLPKRMSGDKTWGLFFIATFLGTFAGLYLQMLAFAHTKAAVVQTLFATSVIFSLLLARMLGEHINRKTAFWSVVALAGVAILVF